MTIFKYLLIGFLGIFFIGCSTKYQSVGFTGGYSETALTENVFRVAFKGNGFTSRDKTIDFTLLRSAEVAKEKGYNYFVIMDSQNYSKIDVHKSRTTYNTSFNATSYGNNISGTANTTSSGGDINVITKPRTTNTIMCFQEKPSLNTIVYDVNFVIKSLKTKYDIKGLVDENSQNTKEDNKTNSKQPIKSSTIQENKQKPFPLLSTRENESKVFAMNKKYHCKIIGYIQHDKLFSLNPNKAPNDAHLMDRYIHLKELNGYKFLLDKEFGLFNYLHKVDNTTIYTNGKADFSILGNATKKIIYFNLSPLEKDYKDNMTFLYQCFDTY